VPDHVDPQRAAVEDQDVRMRRLAFAAAEQRLDAPEEIRASSPVPGTA
jgi:hypothetical protein